MENPKFTEGYLLSQLRDQMRRTKRNPSGQLSQLVMGQLKQFPLETRQSILNSSLCDWSPLFYACKEGLTEIVRFLCGCGADLHCKNYVHLGTTVHFASPLWCATAAGKLDCIKVLLELGADINSVSDTGVTVIHAACLQTRTEVVEYLLENSADLLLPNISGETCLMNSVHSRLLCELLLEKGADVNTQSHNGMTALLCAIEHNNLEVAQLFIEKGANLQLINCNGDDALRLASNKGMISACCYLFECMNLTPEVMADTYELLGAAVSEYNGSLAMHLWNVAADIRESDNIHKQVLPPLGPLGYVSEFTSQAELTSLNTEESCIKMQSLLICQRILGLSHQVSMFHLSSCVRAFLWSRRYQETIQLLLFSLELTASNGHSVHQEMHSIIIVLNDFFTTLFSQYPVAEIRKIIYCGTVGKFLTLISDQINPLIELVRVRPVFFDQECIFNKFLEVFVKMLHVWLLLQPSPEHRRHLAPYIKKLVLRNPRTTFDDFSLLHLAIVTKNFTHWSRATNPERDSLSLSNYCVIQLLLECGADVLAVSRKRIPPLYIASYRNFYCKEVFELLLSYGAHPDQVNCCGDSPLDVLQWHGGGDTFSPLFTPSLKCLAARALKQWGFDFFLPGEVPPSLEIFISLH